VFWSKVESSAYIVPDNPPAHAIFAVEPEVMLKTSKAFVGVIVGVGVLVGVLVGVGDGTAEHKV
jgi:hypothetical protein